jgi:hypothetical protein
MAPGGQNCSLPALSSRCKVRPIRDPAMFYVVTLIKVQYSDFRGEPERSEKSVRLRILLVHSLRDSTDFRNSQLLGFGV